MWVPRKPFISARDLKIKSNNKTKQVSKLAAPARTQQWTTSLYVIEEAHRWSPKNSQPPGISCIFQPWTLAYRSLLGYFLGPDKLKRAPVGGRMSSKRLFHRFRFWVLGAYLSLVPFLCLAAWVNLS